MLIVDYSGTGAHGGTAFKWILLNNLELLPNVDKNLHSEDAFLFDVIYLKSSITFLIVDPTSIQANL